MTAASAVRLADALAADDEAQMPPEVMPGILKDNAVRLLELDRKRDAA